MIWPKYPCQRVGMSFFPVDDDDESAEHEYKFACNARPNHAPIVGKESCHIEKEVGVVCELFVIS